MADEKFDIVKWVKGLVDPTTWAKSVMYLIMCGLIIFVLVCIKNFFFPARTQQVSKPTVVALPGSKIEKDAIHQESTQITVEKEKPFEVGVGAAGMRYDNKDGVIVGAFGKWKF